VLDPLSNPDSFIPSFFAFSGVHEVQHLDSTFGTTAASLAARFQQITANDTLPLLQLLHGRVLCSIESMAIMKQSEPLSSSDSSNNQSEAKQSSSSSSSGTAAATAGPSVLELMRQMRENERVGDHVMSETAIVVVSASSSTLDSKQLGEEQQQHQTLLENELVQARRQLKDGGRASLPLARRLWVECEHRSLSAFPSTQHPLLAAQ
jgi:hypothetical protein